jgi:hypothetical protein
MPFRWLPAFPMQTAPFARVIVADSCGALLLFANVATIFTDAFWFSAVR